MAKILSDSEVAKIEALRKEFRPFSEKGWMAEGNDAYEDVVGVLFNNDTEEMFFYDRSGSVIKPELTDTSYDDAKKMAKIEAKIYNICWR
jgi:hypothetical protein